MLLNKHNLNIAKLALKEASRFTLNSIRVTPSETVVTDGHLLMRVTTPTLNAASFPQSEGLTPLDEFKPFNLSAENALKALAALPKKSTIPVLNCAAVAVNGNPDRLKVITNDLERVGTYQSEENQSFPDFERVMPKEENTRLIIALDARKVKALMEQFIGFQDSLNKRSEAVVTFQFQDDRSGVTMTKKGDDQTMTAVLMPMRCNEDEPVAMRADKLMREYKTAELDRKAEIMDEVRALYA